MAEETSGINWRRITAEGFAIVFSILAALAIDQWWEDFQLAQDEQVLLEDLAQEIEAAYGDLQDAVDGQGVVPIWAARSTYFTERTPIDSIAASLRVILYYYSADVQLSSVTSVLASARLDDLQTEGLPEWIAAWPVRAGRIEDQGQTVREYVHGVAAPYLAERGIPLTPAYRGFVPGIALSEAIPVEELRAIVGDRGLDALFNHAGLISYNFIDSARSAQAQLEEGYAIVQAGLGNEDVPTLAERRAHDMASQDPEGNQ